MDVHDRITEGRPGAHGRTVFTLTAATMTDDPSAVLTTLYEGGTRSVLVACHPDLARRMLASNLVDQIVCYAVPANPSGAGTPIPGIPSTGLDITAVDAVDGWVRIHATPSRPMPQRPQENR